MTNARDPMSEPSDRSISRRDLLRGGFLRAARGADDTPARLTIKGERAADSQSAPPPRHRPFPVIRPPGAVDEAEFLTGCTRCSACIDACPHDAIIEAGPRFRQAAGTPTIDPARQPCLMCEDLPCAHACEPDVLRAHLPRRIAMANLLTYNCLAWQGSFCTVCAEHCPEPGALTIEGGKPVIHESICTGCGICHHVCPAPTNAIAIMPLQSRPKGGADPTQGGGGGGRLRRCDESEQP